MPEGAGAAMLNTKASHSRTGPLRLFLNGNYLSPKNLL